MARIHLAVAPGFTVGVEYNAGNGRASSLVAVNNSGHSIFARATLTDGRQFGQVFASGETPVNFPSNVVSVTFDGLGEPMLVGLSKVETRDPA